MNELINIHNKTKINIEKSSRNIFSEYPPSWIKIYTKSYPRFKKIKLPIPRKISKRLYGLITTRKSIRKFNNIKISKQELSEILFYSVGIINYSKVNSFDETKRAYPSAGARYPVEFYLSISNCEGIDSGVYHYNVKYHSLELMIIGDNKEIINKFSHQDMIKSSSIIFILTGVFNRSQVKYGIRAYRYVLLDLGHLTQNIYLVSNNLNIGCCTIGGFSDNKINKFLDLEENEQVLYMGVLGKYDKN